MSPELPQRRSTDSPKQHAIRFAASLVYGGLVLAAAVTLRALGLVGETPFLVLILAAGVVVKGESLLGFVRAWKRNGSSAS